MNRTEHAAMAGSSQRQRKASSTIRHIGPTAERYTSSPKRYGWAISDGGIASHSDPAPAFPRSDDDICLDVVRDVVRSATVPGRSNVRVVVSEGVVCLFGHVTNALTARGLADAAARVTGVVDVQNDLTFDVDDTYPLVKH